MYELDLKFIILGFILGIILFSFRTNKFRGYEIGEFDILFLKEVLDKNKFYFKHKYLSYDTKNRLRRMRKSLLNLSTELFQADIQNSKLAFSRLTDKVLMEKFNKWRILKTIYFKEYRVIVTQTLNTDYNVFLRTVVIIKNGSKDIAYYSSISINGVKKEFTYLDPDISINDINKFPYIGDFDILNWR